IEKRWTALQQERGYEHRAHGHAEELLIQGLRQEPGDSAFFRQHKRELANLRHGDARQQRDATRVAHQGRADGRRQRLAAHDHGDRHQRETDVRLDGIELDEHADGDEKQRNEDVAEWHQLGERLIAVVGLGDNQAGQKCAEGKRCPGGSRAECRERADQNDGDQEQLAAACLENLRKRARQMVRAAIMTPTTTSAAFPKATSSPTTPPPALPARNGSTNMIGTTQRSWKIRTPVARRPCGASILLASVRTLSTMAVLDSAIRNLRKSANGQL